MRRLITITCVMACACLLWMAHDTPAASYRHLRYHVHPCLAAIVDKENRKWDPTEWNDEGSGAYGLPQALPASKMASAGPDWRTNPVTQLRWMASYVRSRYGGPCEALAFHRRNGWY